MDVVDWSELPSELVDIVAKKLTVYRDYIRFRAVCVKWRYSIISPRPNHLPIQLPWLMLPFGPNDESRCSFFDLSEKKFHWLDLPKIHPSRCCGSSQGWLVFVQEHYPIIRVFNPFTRVQYYLPPVTTYPDAWDFNTKTFVREYLRVVLSSSPSLTNDYIFALAILKKTKNLAFCKQGVEGWSVIKDARSYCEDAIYYNGAFYAVNKQGSIAICHLSGISPVVTLITPPPISGHDHLYLVDSSFGELLLVARYLGVVSDRASDLIYGTNKFRVFTLDSSKPEWVEKKSLGDQMLFVGGDSSVCLSASDFPGRIGNCIYFTYNYVSSRTYCELGVFDLKVGQIMPLQFGIETRKSVFPPPMWVIPNPC